MAGTVGEKQQPSSNDFSAPPPVPSSWIQTNDQTSVNGRKVYEPSRHAIIQAKNWREFRCCFGRQATRVTVWSFTNKTPLKLAPIKSNLVLHKLVYEEGEQLLREFEQGSLSLEESCEFGLPNNYKELRHELLLQVLAKRHSSAVVTRNQSCFVVGCILVTDGQGWGLLDVVNEAEMSIHSEVDVGDWIILKPGNKYKKLTMGDGEGGMWKTYPYKKFFSGMEVKLDCFDVRNVKHVPTKYLGKPKSLLSKSFWKQLEDDCPWVTPSEITKELNYEYVNVAGYCCWVGRTERFRLKKEPSVYEFVRNEEGHTSCELSTVPQFVVYLVISIVDPGDPSKVIPVKVEVSKGCVPKQAKIIPGLPILLTYCEIKCDELMNDRLHLRTSLFSDLYFEEDIAQIRFHYRYSLTTCHKLMQLFAHETYRKFLEEREQSPPWAVGGTLHLNPFIRSLRAIISERTNSTTTTNFNGNNPGKSSSGSDMNKDDAIEVEGDKDNVPFPTVAEIEANLPLPFECQLRKIASARIVAVGHFSEAAYVSGEGPTTLYGDFSKGNVNERPMICNPPVCSSTLTCSKRIAFSLVRSLGRGCLPSEPLKRNQIARWLEDKWGKYRSPFLVDYDKDFTDLAGARKETHHVVEQLERSGAFDRWLVLLLDERRDVYYECWYLESDKTALDSLLERSFEALVHVSMTPDTVLWNEDLKSRSRKYIRMYKHVRYAEVVLDSSQVAAAVAIANNECGQARENDKMSEL